MNIKVSLGFFLIFGLELFGQQVVFEQNLSANIDFRNSTECYSALDNDKKQLVLF